MKSEIFGEDDIDAIPPFVLDEKSEATNPPGQLVDQGDAQRSDPPAPSQG